MRQGLSGWMRGRFSVLPVCASIFWRLFTALETSIPYLYYKYTRNGALSACYHGALHETPSWYAPDVCVCVYV